MTVDQQVEYMGKIEREIAICCKSPTNMGRMRWRSARQAFPLIGRVCAQDWRSALPTLCSMAGRDWRKNGCLSVRRADCSILFRSCWRWE